MFSLLTRCVGWVEGQLLPLWMRQVLFQNCIKAAAKRGTVGTETRKILMAYYHLQEVNVQRALRRVCVAYAPEQEDQIMQLYKAGDLVGAQKIILDKLRKDIN